MENQNRLKLRLSRLLRSSFGSCKSRNISDDIVGPESVTQTRQHYQLIQLFSPKPSSETELFLPDPSPLLAPAKSDGRKCPPASPISPLNTFFPKIEKPESKPKKKKPKNKTKNPTQFVNMRNLDDYYDDNEAENDDESETTLFSSLSLSSDSSDSSKRNRANYRGNRLRKQKSEMGLVELQGKVKDSFVVTKQSSDPHEDFRNSMVEMIIEKQIFGGRELEDLLQTFLSLNSYHHHRVIVEVFTEIWEALFSNCC